MIRGPLPERPSYTKDASKLVRCTQSKNMATELMDCAGPMSSDEGLALFRSYQAYPAQETIEGSADDVRRSDLGTHHDQ